MRGAKTAALFLLITASPLVIADGDAEAGKLKAYTCTGCHGIPGYNNTYPTYKVPKIGGQSRQYLESALLSYQSGARLHKTMHNHASSFSEQDIRDIAAWLSGFTTRVSEPASPGEAPEKVQLCQSCHGENGMGADPAYPALAGQYASYLERALQDYRSGNRVNPIMGGFASGLSDSDIEQLAQWYANKGGLVDLSQ